LWAENQKKEGPSGRLGAPGWTGGLGRERGMFRRGGGTMKNSGVKENHHGEKRATGGRHGKPSNWVP